MIQSHEGDLSFYYYIMQNCYLDLAHQTIQYENENWKLIPLPLSKEEVESVESKYIKIFIKEWVHRVLNNPLPAELDLQDY